MKAQQSHHETAASKTEEASEMRVVTSGEEPNGDVSKQGLRQKLQESRESEARLRKIIDTIPALAWCNLTDGSNDFVAWQMQKVAGACSGDLRPIWLPTVDTLRNFLLLRKGETLTAFQIVHETGSCQLPNGF